MSYGISSADYKGTINQITNLLDKFSGSSFKCSGYINSVFSAAEDFENIASDDPNKVGTGIQGIIGKAMDLVAKLISPEADATKRVAKDAEGAKEVQKSTEEIKAELNASMEEASKEIGKQTKIVTDAQGEISEVQSELQEKEEEIKTIIENIKTAQAELAAATTEEEKIALLQEIDCLGGEIISLLSNISDLQDVVTEASAEVETALVDIETAKGNAVERQEDGQLKITTAVQDAAQTTTETIETGVDGTKNEILGAELEALAAGEAATVFGIPAAAATAEKGAEVIAAGGIEIAGAGVNLRSLLQGIGGIANNTELLATFRNAIGGALEGFNNAIGGWNEFITPVITSLGTLGGEAGYAAQAQALKVVVAEDYAELNIHTVNEDGTFERKDGSFGAFGAARETMPFATNDINPLLLAQNQEEVELKTPKFQFGL